MSRIADHKFDVHKVKGKARFTPFKIADHLPGFARQGRKCAERPRHVAWQHRVSLKARVAEPSRRAALAPALAGRQKIEAGSKAKLTDVKSGRKPRRQVVSGQKDVAGFLQPVDDREIRVVKTARHRQRLVAPIDFRLHVLVVGHRLP